MKTVCLIFTIGCAVLMCVASYAASVDPAPQQSSESSMKAGSGDRANNATPADGGTHGGKPSDEKRDRRRVPGKDYPPSQASLPKANRPNQIPNRQEHSTTANAMNLHKPGSDKSSGAVKGGLIQNEKGNHVLPVRSPSIVRPSVSPLDNVRHRGPNPAVIGGSANSITRNTGAINGTRMNRKP